MLLANRKPGCNFAARAEGAQQLPTCPLLGLGKLNEVNCRLNSINKDEEDPRGEKQEQGVARCYNFCGSGCYFNTLERGRGLYDTDSIYGKELASGRLSICEQTALWCPHTQDTSADTTHPSDDLGHFASQFFNSHTAATV